MIIASAAIMEDCPAVSCLDRPSHTSLIFPRVQFSKTHFSSLALTVCLRGRRLTILPSVVEKNDLLFLDWDFTKYSEHLLLSTFTHTLMCIVYVNDRGRGCCCREVPEALWLILR